MTDVTNLDFLLAVFRDIRPGHEAIACCGLGCDPTHGGAWVVHNFWELPSVVAYGRPVNTYYCVSSVVPGRRLSRKTARRLFALPIDDVGTKGTPPSLPPSYAIETSPGNWQYGYLLSPPVDRIRPGATADCCRCTRPR